MEETFKIISLPKEEWEGVEIPMRYTTEGYYDVQIERDASSMSGCKERNLMNLYPITRRNMISQTNCISLTGRRPVHGGL